MLYNELDVKDFEVTVETALLEDEELMDWILSEMEEEEANIEEGIIEEPKQLLMVRADFEVKDPFYNDTLNEEVFASTYEKMMEKFSKRLEELKARAELYGCQTAREVEIMALNSFTTHEYYE